MSLEILENINLIKERVRWAINYVAREHGMTNEKLAKIIGCSTSTINSYRRMITVPGLEFFVLFIYKYSFNLDWFTMGKGEPFPGAREKYPDVCGSLTDESRHVHDDYNDEYVLIPQINGKISAGNGIAPDNTADLKVAFRKDWIKRKGEPDKMSLIKVEGDSMEPTILSGDLVLIDHGRNYIAPQGGIYALSINHEIMIKRIHPLQAEGKLRIISDNKQYEPIEIEAENVKINGKVIWFAREIER